MASRRSRKNIKARESSLQQAETSSQTTKKKSRRGKRVVTVPDSDVVDLWDNVGKSKGLSTDTDIARYLLSL